MNRESRPSGPASDSSANDETTVPRSEQKSSDQPSAWWDALAEARMTEIGTVRTDELVIGALCGEIAESEDRMCDRCRRDVPEDAKLTIFAVAPQPGVCLIGALCRDCASVEVFA
jgi:hypothetical protein